MNWIEFSIQLFDYLLAYPNVTLADGNGQAAADGYLILECFPTSAWRSSGLRPLPAKAKNPPLDGYRDSLRVAYGLPEFNTDNHDDLQAVVAALCAVGAIGGPAVGIPRGVEPRVVQTGRVEGFIWDVTPVGGVIAIPPALPPAQVAPNPTHRETDGASVYVTPGVVAQVNRAGVSQMQITLRGLPSATKDRKLRVALTVDSVDYVLVLGDSHAAWRTHQDSSSSDSFDQLFAAAADTPGLPLAVSAFEILNAGSHRR